MSSSAGLDIRLPIGGLFAVLGLLLAGYGLATAGDGEHYARSMGVNVNLWWGLVMLLTGLALLRADPRLPRAFMNDDWPADRSFEVYWVCRRALEEPAAAQFAALAGVSPRSAPADRPSAPSLMPSAATRRR